MSTTDENENQNEKETENEGRRTKDEGRHGVSAVHDTLYGREITEGRLGHVMRTGI